MTIAGDNAGGVCLHGGGEHVIVLWIVGDDFEREVAGRNLAEFSKHGEVVLDVPVAEGVLLCDVRAAQDVAEFRQSGR